MNKRLKQKISKAVIEGIRKNADRIFDLSQDTTAGYVPVDIGTLKLSGISEDIKGGKKIAYRTNYAAQVEFGIPEDIPITGTQKIHVPEYIRKGYKRKDGVWVPPTKVKAHEVKLVNKRVIRIKPSRKYVEEGIHKREWGKPIFRVIDKIKAREGQYFLTRSVKEGLKKLADDMEFFLRQIVR